MRWVIIVIILSAIGGLSSCRTDPPNATVEIDSLLRNDKFAEAEPIIHSRIAKVNSDTLKAKLYSRMALCKHELSDSDSALYYYQLSADVSKNTNCKFRIGNAYREMGMIYTLRQYFGEARHLYNEALKCYDTVKDSIDVYNALCVHFINRGRFDSLNVIITTYLIRHEKEMEFTESYYIYFGRGIYFYNIQNYDSALFFLQAAVHRAPDKFYKANTFTNIAEVYKYKHKYTKAIAYLDSAGLLYGDDKAVDNRQYDYNLYREIYDSLENYKLAYHYAQLYQSVSDTIYNPNNGDAMITSVTDAKTKPLKEKNDKILADNRLILTILILVVLLAFVAFRNTRIKQKANLILTQQKQQVQQLADQLAVANDTKARLFSTIGHDLRSPVSSLYASLKMQELKGNATGGDMSEQTVRLLDTLEELLIWSKSQMDGFKVQPVKLNVRYFFEDLKEFYTNAAEAKNICIVNDTTKDVVMRADENLLKTIFRNAISNAITNTEKGNTIQLTATQDINGKTCMAIINPCCKESFQKFKNNFDDAAVKSGAYGLGIVLMKEFAQKLGGSIELAYTANSASLRLCI